MNQLDKKINNHFAGKVVRKDLTKLVKGNATVPTYVLEYLLGQYCATDNEDIIDQGVENVKNILSKHLVQRDQAQLIRSQIREKGNYRIIDNVSVVLNDKKDQYEAEFESLGLKNVPIADHYVKSNPKLLSGGVWCIMNIGYVSTDERDKMPWIVESLKPIQISNIDVDEFKERRKEFNIDEWLDLLMQTIGLNPDEFSRRSKFLQLLRLVSFVENNYNFIELGPKGTGKTHIFTELSPHCILVSGGSITTAKLFVNNASKKVGLVGHWDVVTLDEFAGKNKRPNGELIDTMKNYMANRSFNRGTSNKFTESASMAFVGNTDHSVPHMLKNSHLFEALPPHYIDSAFLDRFHAYLPGWEIQRLRNDMFTSNYGFIVDYLAEVLKELRKEDFSNLYRKYFELSNTIATRDLDPIKKTFSGLCKILYPNGIITEEQAKEILDFAMESRCRVQKELMKIDETITEVEFSYVRKLDNTTVNIQTLEMTAYADQLEFEKEEESEDKPKKRKKRLRIGEGKNPNPEIHSTNQVDAEQKTVSEPIAPTFELSEAEREVASNATGYSYDRLFGAYLYGATEVCIIDSYIKLPHQFRNLVELMQLFIEVKDRKQKIKIKLRTTTSDTFQDQMEVAFYELTQSLTDDNIEFSYDYTGLHDRSIIMDNGWQIKLGRGLDIWQKTDGMFDLSSVIQTHRKCRDFSVTIRKHNKVSVFV